MKKYSFILFLFSFFAYFLAPNVSFAQASCPAENTPPPEVQNLKATLGDGKNINLTWDSVESESDVVIDYKLYYGTSSVEGVDDFYDNEMRLGQGQANAYMLENLQDGTYFFAITAIDSSDCESLNYSIETSVTMGEAPEEPKIEEPVEEAETETEQEVFSDSAAEAPLVEEETEVETVSSFPIPEIKAELISDKTPPENPADMQVSKKDFSETGLLTLSWKIPQDADLADQILYTKQGSGAWDSGYSIGKDIDALEVSAEKNKSYLYKITAIDTEENESSGLTLAVNTEVKPLAASGSGVEILLWGLAVFIFFGFIFKLKKNTL